MIKEIIEIKKIVKNKEQLKYYIYPELIDKIKKQDITQEYLYLVHVTGDNIPLVLFSNSKIHILYSKNHNIRYYNEKFEQILRASSLNSDFYSEIKCSGLISSVSKGLFFNFSKLEDKKASFKIHEDKSNHIKTITFSKLGDFESGFIRTMIINSISKTITVNFSRSLLKKIEYTFSGELVSVSLVGKYKSVIDIEKVFFKTLDYKTIMEATNPCFDLYRLIHDKVISYISENKFNSQIELVKMLVSSIIKVNFNSICESMNEIKLHFQEIYKNHNLQKSSLERAIYYGVDNNEMLNKFLDQNLFDSILRIEKESQILQS